MNKLEFIEIEVNKNKAKFGKYHSSTKKNSCDESTLCLQPKNEEESTQYGNALASTGHYPVGLSGCFTVGISGNCGLDCYVYLDGNCDEPDGMINTHIENDEQLKQHIELYGDSND